MATTDALLAPASAPAGFVDDEYRHVWTIARPRTAVWAWLCDPATFTDGQIPPYRVEFVAPDGGQGGFETGVFTNHSGPFMTFAGVLGDIREEEYRDLRYCYGSYAVSFRLARPTRLQFWLADGAEPGTTELTLQVDAQVHRRFRRTWRRAMGVFWRRFGRWCASQA